MRPDSPVLLRVVAEELDESGSADGVAVTRAARDAETGEVIRAETTVAVVVDDVVNRPPKFGQTQ